jgi:hypothetical protein
MLTEKQSVISYSYAVKLQKAGCKAKSFLGYVVTKSPKKIHLNRFIMFETIFQKLSNNSIFVPAYNLHELMMLLVNTEIALISTPLESFLVDNGDGSGGVLIDKREICDYLAAVVLKELKKNKK